MDYEKKYNEALERAKELLLGNEHSNTIRSYFEHIFPELRESEDERIRKWLVNYFGSIKETVWIHMDITCEQILGWLEKQKEQKPNSTEDMPYVADEHFFEQEPADSFKYKLAEYMTKSCTKKESPYGYSYSINSESILQMAKEELIKRGELKEQKPVEWSEEDEAIFDKALDAVYYQDCNDKQDVLYALKGLCDLISKKRKVIPVCQRWKPSEEQMRALDKVVNGEALLITQHKSLESLYEQLKKL